MQRLVLYRQLATLPRRYTPTRCLSRGGSGLSRFLPPAKQSGMSPSFDAHPLSSAASPPTFGNFDLVKQVKLDFADVLVSKWRSRITGLSVVHLDYDAPIVNGYFVVPTEIFNDTGCPHTLEHLIFMGSEKYPYKGIIDHLANRGFSNGTNAWTANDHTAYTVSTAGEQGFLQILPIYVDHVLYPTLTKSSFVTEVHHVDGKGQDSGVVYSEMQGRQNSSGDLLALKLQQIINPLDSAYRSETGGLMGALRTLTIEQIRDYHRSYYVPHNLSLIVAGKFSQGISRLLSVLQDKVEPSLVAHGQKAGSRPPGWRRPFLETASANRRHIPTTVSEIVEFPEKDVSMGEMVIGFMGPPPGNFLEQQALDVLGTYLTSSATAPLNKEFIEIESPVCSYIYFAQESRATLIDLTIYVGSVPTEHLGDFYHKLKASFKRIVQEGIDMERMQMVIRRDERQLRSKLESGKGDTFSSTIISDFLYGPEDGSELQSSMNEINEYDKLRSWRSQQWADLFQRYYIDPSCVIVVGKPSTKLAEQIEREEKIRIAKQIEKLGPDGLKEAEAELEKAKAEHDIPIPTDVLTSFPLPDVKSIAWIPVQSVQEPGIGRPHRFEPAQSELQKHITSDGRLLPFFVQYDHVKSDFVTITVFLSLAKLPDRLRPYISVYLSAFFSLPVNRQSGQRLAHEEVINKLDDETVSYGASFGLSGQLSENLHISIKVETKLYDVAVAWLYDLIYNSEFDKERLQVTAAKIQQSLPEMRRDGSGVSGSLWSELLCGENSTMRMATVLPQSNFIPILMKQLQDKPDSIVADFMEIRRYLTDPAGIRFSVAGNILTLDKPRTVLAKYFAHALPAIPLAPVPLTSETLGEIGRNPSKQAIVMSLPTIETSYATHTTKCIQGFDHVDYPVLRLAIEVLNATESFLWRFIRGSGLAYGAYVSLDNEAGHLSFSLYRATNSLQAYKEAATVVRGLADGSISLDDTTLEAAKSSLVYGVAKNVATAGRAAMVSFTNQALKGIPKNFQVQMLGKYQEITKKQVVETLRTYFLPLFDPATSVAVIVTAPSKIDDIVEGLTTVGFDVERRTLQDSADLEGSEYMSDGETDDSR